MSNVQLKEKHRAHSLNDDNYSFCVAFRVFLFAASFTTSEHEIHKQVHSKLMQMITEISSFFFVDSHVFVWKSIIFWISHGWFIFFFFQVMKFYALKSLEYFIGWIGSDFLVCLSLFMSGTPSKNNVISSSKKKHITHRSSLKLWFNTKCDSD